MANRQHFDQRFRLPAAANADNKPHRNSDSNPDCESESDFVADPVTIIDSHPSDHFGKCFQLCFACTDRHASGEPDASDSPARAGRVDDPQRFSERNDRDKWLGKLLVRRRSRWQLHNHAQQTVFGARRSRD